MSKPVEISSVNGMGYPIGIDFGTSNSSMSKYVQNNIMGNGPQSLNFPITGKNLYPSFALIDNRKNIVYTGLPAYNKRFVEPENVISSVKRKIKSKDSYVVNGKIYSNKDIVSCIISDFIKEIKMTDHQLHPKVVVETVPYYFGENENFLIKEAVTMAINEQLGSDIKVFLIPEPIAASLAFLYEMKEETIDSETILVYDIGGGTLDLTLIKITNSLTTFNYEVLANVGIAKFGGDDIDMLLYDYIVKHEKLDFSTLPNRHKLSNTARLINEVIEVKQQLSTQNEYTFLCSNLIGTVPYVELVVTRELLESLLSGKAGSDRNMLGEFKDCLNKLFYKALKTPECVNMVLPVGGTSQIPIFRHTVNSICKNAKEVKTNDSTNIFTMVANGASVFGAMKCDELYGTSYRPFKFHNTVERITTRISHALYLQKYNGKLDLLIPSNAISPTRVLKTYFPSKFKQNDELVELSKVELFQAQGESKKNGNKIGAIDFSRYDIYSHGRDLKNIPISLMIEATDTAVKINCSIPKATQDGNDINFTQIIHYS